ncbi:MAG TPA: NUDIX domain-containing protein [Pilimelia sp.]|nr:NUDIX domain-containing protein [Pilimelia sp.]
MAGIPWAESYLGQLRALAGERTLLFVGARAVVRDADGRVLLIRRSDNGRWAVPAGAMELGESIVDCGVRELYEETGLRAAALTPYAMYTGPAYTHTNMYGDAYQLFIVAFRVDEWSGELLRETDETTDARFFDAAELTGELSPVVRETLSDLAAYERTGRLVLK